MFIRSLGPILLTMLFVGPALAQDSAAAEALFRSARKAADQGDWVTACDRFEESKRLEPAPGTVLNLARCREELGQVASAWKNYGEAAERLPERDDRRAFARRKAADLLAEVPKLTLHPPADDVEISVLVRDMELSKATFGVPLPLDPGPVVVIVRAKGREDSVAHLTLEKAQQLSHQLELGPLVGEAPPQTDARPVQDEPSPRAPSSRRALGKGFMIAGGAGAVAATVGGIWAGVELSTVKDEENCRDGKCNQVGSDAAARGRTAVVILGAGSVICAVGLGLGGYFLFAPSEDTTVSVKPEVGGGVVSFRALL